MDRCEKCGCFQSDVDIRWGWCARCGNRNRDFYGSYYDDRGVRQDDPYLKPSSVTCSKCGGDHAASTCAW